LKIPFDNVFEGFLTAHLWSHHVWYPSWTTLLVSWVSHFTSTALIFELRA
jgi:hypothetical protein